MVTNPVLAVVLTYLFYFVALLLQIWLSARAGLLAPGQRNRDTEGLPLVAHGGTWTTYLIVLPVVMYVVGNYGPHWHQHQVNVALLIGVLLAALWYWYVAAKTPEGSINGPYLREGRPTLAGWVRLVQTMLGIAVLCAFFIDRQVSLKTHLVTTGLLTVHVIFGTHFGLRTYAAYKKWKKDGYTASEMLAFVFDGSACGMVALCVAAMVGSSFLVNR